MGEPDVVFNVDMDVVSRRRLVLCLPGCNFSLANRGSLLQLLNWCQKNGWNITVRSAYRANIFAVRNHLFGLPIQTEDGKWHDDLLFEGEIPEYSHILWIDSDMIYEPRHFEKLLLRKKPIICGAAKKIDGKFAIVEKYNEEYMSAHGHHQFLVDKDMEMRTEPFPVAFTGMAFMLIEKGVVEQMTYPWITMQYDERDGITYPRGEDVSFCERAQGLGYKIWVDPLVRIGHEKLQVIR